MEAALVEEQQEEERQKQRTEEVEANMKWLDQEIAKNEREARLRGNVDEYIFDDINSVQVTTTPNGAVLVNNDPGRTDTVIQHEGMVMGTFSGNVQEKMQDFAKEYNLAETASYTFTYTQVGTGTAPEQLETEYGHTMQPAAEYLASTRGFPCTVGAASVLASGEPNSAPSTAVEASAAGGGHTRPENTRGGGHGGLGGPNQSQHATGANAPLAPHNDDHSAGRGGQYRGGGRGGRGGYRGGRGGNRQTDIMLALELQRLTDSCATMTEVLERMNRRLDNLEAKQVQGNNVDDDVTGQ